MSHSNEHVAWATSLVIVVVGATVEPAMAVPAPQAQASERTVSCETPQAGAKALYDSR